MELGSVSVVNVSRHSAVLSKGMASLHLSTVSQMCMPMTSFAHSGITLQFVAAGGECPTNNKIVALMKSTNETLLLYVTWVIPVAFRHMLLHLPKPGT
jgi:hypothetical protein